MESRDLDTLKAKRALVDQALSQYEEALRGVELGGDDAEDPARLVEQLENAANEVHDRLWTPPAPENQH